MIRTIAALYLIGSYLLGQNRAPDDPFRIAAIVSDASRALEAGRPDDAERLLAQAAPAGRDLRVEILRAEVLLARKNPAGAAETIAAAIAALAPQGEIARTAHRTHARALIGLGKPAEAAPAILRSLGLDATAVSALALAARGLAESGDRRTARGLLAVAAHLAPDRVDLLRTAGALAIEDGDPAAALRDAKALVERLPGDREARILRARSLHALGRAMEARDALAALDRVSALDPVLLRVLARLDLEAGLVEDAHDAMRRAGPIDADSAALLASGWMDQGQPRKALLLLDDLTLAIEADPLARIRAHAHLALLEGPQALAALARLRRPSDDDLIARARAERLAGDLPAAARVLEEILARDPAAHRARGELIEIRMVEGAIPEARRLLDAGLVLAPSDARFTRALEDLVPELSPPQSGAIVAVLGAAALAFYGAPVDTRPAEATRQLRAARLARGSATPLVHLLVSGPIDAAALQRALDVLTAAGFTRVRLEAK